MFMGHETVDPGGGECGAKSSRVGKLTATKFDLGRFATFRLKIHLYFCDVKQQAKGFVLPSEILYIARSPNFYSGGALIVTLFLVHNHLNLTQQSWHIKAPLATICLRWP